MAKNTLLLAFAALGGYMVYKHQAEARAAARAAATTVGKVAAAQLAEPGGDVQSISQPAPLALAGGVLDGTGFDKHSLRSYGKKGSLGR